jgi:hypothetical protein
VNAYEHAVRTRQRQGGAIKFLVFLKKNEERETGGLSEFILAKKNELATQLPESTPPIE